MLVSAKVVMEVGGLRAPQGDGRRGPAAYTKQSGARAVVYLLRQRVLQFLRLLLPGQAS